MSLQTCKNGSCLREFNGAPGLCPECNAIAKIAHEIAGNPGLYFMEKTTNVRIEVVLTSNPKADAVETFRGEISDAIFIHDDDCAGLMEVTEISGQPVLQCTACTACFQLYQGGKTVGDIVRALTIVKEGD